MKTILFVLSALTAAHSISTAPIVCIGVRCSGQGVSIEYLENNPYLKAPEGFSIKSFTISFTANGALIEKGVQGNSFKEMLPHLKKLQVGQKVYFDNVVLISQSGAHTKISGSFRIEAYTNLTPFDMIYLGKNLNGDHIDVTQISEQDSLWYVDLNYQVKEYSISLDVSGSIYDKKCFGNKVPSDVINLIKRTAKGKKIYFDLLLKHKSEPNKKKNCVAIFTAK